MKRIILFLLFVAACFSNIPNNTASAASIMFQGLVFDMGARTFSGVLNNSGPGAGTNNPTLLSVSLYAHINSGVQGNKQTVIPNVIPWESGPFTVPLPANFNFAHDVNEYYPTQGAYGAFINPSDANNNYGQLEFRANDSAQTTKDGIGFRIINAGTSSGSGSTSNSSGTTPQTSSIIVSDLIIDLNSGTLSGVFGNSGPNPDTEIDAEVIKENTGNFHDLVNGIIWKQGPFTVDLDPGYIYLEHDPNSLILPSVNSYSALLNTTFTTPMRYNLMTLTSDDGVEEDFNFSVIPKTTGTTPSATGGTSPTGTTDNPGSNQGPSSGPAIVKVFWDTPFLKNTEETNKSGHWYYGIKTTEDVERLNDDQDIYLILMKTNKQTGNKIPIVLGTYSAGSGTSFSLVYPSCTDLNCSEVTQSGIESGYDYEVYFSSTQSGSDIVHTADSQQALSLPSVPETITSAEGNITITDAKFVTDSGMTFIQVSGDVLRDIEGSYTFFVAAKDADGSRDKYIYRIGLVPGDLGQYSVPFEAYPMDITYDDYDIEIQFNNRTIHTHNVGAPTSPGTFTGGSTPSGGDKPSDRSYPSGEGGIVPDCGYNIGPGKSGRICGFSDAITLIQNAIEYIFVLVLPIAAIVFAYAGFMFLSSGGNPNKRSAAKKAMINVIIGIVIVMLAWLLVKTVLVALGASDGFTMFLDIRN